MKNNNIYIGNRGLNDYIANKPTKFPIINDNLEKYRSKTSIYPETGSPIDIDDDKQKNNY